MRTALWMANPGGDYWIDVSLGGHPLEVLIDTGMIDSRGQVGFSVDASLYDQIKCSGGFRSHQTHTRLMADGLIATTESGELDAQMVCPRTRNPVGPIVSLFVYRGATGVPDRVGVAFFHRLKGCKVQWDLDQRSWAIEYP